MFLTPINISTFRFSPSKKFLQLLVPIKFSITTFGLCFQVNFSIFLMKCVEYCKNISQKKLEFLNKT